MILCKRLIFCFCSLVLFSCSLFENKYKEEIIAQLPKVKKEVNFKVLWKALIRDKKEIYSNLHPAYQKNMVFAANRFGIVKAFDIKNGKVKWKANLFEKNSFKSKDHFALLSGGITVAGERIYVTTERGKVFALDTKDGKIVWKTEVNAEALSAPVLSDGFVLIHTNNGMLKGLDENNGDIVWSRSLGTSSLSLRGESAPVVVFGMAIIGDDNGFVKAVSVKNGETIWERDISGSIGTTEVSRFKDIDVTPVVINEVVYIISYNGNLVALKLGSGEVLWKNKIGGFKNLIADNSNARLYLGDQDDNIMALNSNNGLILWKKYDFLHRKLASLLPYRGNLVTADIYGYLYYINSINGKIIGEELIDRSGFQSYFFMVMDKLVIQARNGMIYLIDCR